MFVANYFETIDGEESGKLLPRAEKVINVKINLQRNTKPNLLACTLNRILLTPKHFLKMKMEILRLKLGRMKNNMINNMKMHKKTMMLSNYNLKKHLYIMIHITL
jgi:hypothetical protein